MGFINDVVNGKEKKIRKDPLSGQINQAGQTGLSLLTGGADKLSNIYNQDPTQLVETQIGMENKFARGAADDVTRRTRDLITQRGIASSSIGLGQEVNQRKSLMDKLAMNKASGIERLRNAQIENAQGLMDTGNNLYNIKAAQGIQMNDQKYRTGGYGQLIAGGMQAGAQMYAANKKGQKQQSPSVAMTYDSGEYSGYA